MSLPADTVALISGFGDDGEGGLFAFDGTSLTQLDEQPTTGVAVGDGRVARALRTADDPSRPAEILVYEESGFDRELQVDAPDPHDLVTTARGFAVVSSISNSIVEFSDRGEIVLEWTAPGEGDAWHLNGLTVVDGEWYVTAFGEFSRHREWAIRGCIGTGFVRELATGRNVISNLSSPHHPRLVDDHWLVCDSANLELLELDPANGEERRLELGRFTRGLAATQGHLLVGLSGGRSGGDDKAEVAVVERSTLDAVTRIALPCNEIYDIVLAPAWAARSIAQSPRRPTPRRLARLNPLPAPDARLSLDVNFLPTAPAGEIVGVDCRVTNAGSAVIASIGTWPVQIGYRWSRDGNVWEGPVRARLPRALGPNESASVKLPVIVPDAAGKWVLTISGVQEGVAWFDDLDPANGLVKDVEVS